MSKPALTATKTPVPKPMTATDVYNTHLTKYPDVLSVPQVSEILGVSTKTVYSYLKSKELASLEVGRAYRIPKVFLLQFLKLIDRNVQTD